jgi:hypothetical protein
MRPESGPGSQEPGVQQQPSMPCRSNGKLYMQHQYKQYAIQTVQDSGPAHTTATSCNKAQEG